MNIAQGLRRIRQLKGQMAELTARAASVVSYDVVRKPDFDFAATRAKLGTVREELVRLEAAVAKANATANITANGREMSLAEAVRRLQELKAEMVWLSSLHLRYGTERVPETDYEEATGRVIRKTREVVYASGLTEPERAAELDRLRDAFQRLNDAVETANHRVEFSPPELPAA